jgi:ribonuclease R
VTPKDRRRPSGWRELDPSLSREARLYSRPIPSREFLIDYLREAGKPRTWERLCQDLGLDDYEGEALQRRLDAMVRDGQLVRNRRDGYLLVNRTDLISGRVVGHPDGYGFLIPDDGSADLYLSAREMRTLVHGDRAVMRVAGVDRRGRREGALVEVLERNTRQVVGRLFVESGVAFVVPDNARVRHDILVSPQDLAGARAGQIVVVDLVEQPSARALPVGRVVEVLGDHMGPGMEVDIAIRSHGLPYAWPEAVEQEAASFGHRVPEAAVAGRVDLRGTPLVTIDGADAKDFDDAVYCERKPKGWKVVVAIADVSAYVRPGTALDAEARLRGTSVYFPGRVIPMLPEALSNGLCSLNPEVDRLCMACEMYVGRDGEVTRSKFYQAVMRSHARLTYDTVAGILVERDRDLRRAHEPLLVHLEELHALYRALRAAREKRGAIDFETLETRIVFGPSRKIERIEPVERNDAHRLIEECMIAANVAAARFLQRHRMPALYRIHDGPTREKLEALREFLAEIGLRLAGGEAPEPRHYARLLREIEGRPDRHLIQTVLLRSLAQAVYAPATTGHFGLALAAYAHFTSPIRRYPDLLVHRAIRHLLEGGKAADFTYRQVDMVPLGEHCSMSERRADEATRDAVDWLKCEHMLDRVGEVFAGTVSAVTSFGLFVELDGIYVEGLVHITALKADFYHFEPVHHRLVGERTRRTYRLGDRLRVRVVRVDLDDRKIDFELAEEVAAAAAAGDGRRRGRRRGRGRGK